MRYKNRSKDLVVITILILTLITFLYFSGINILLYLTGHTVNELQTIDSVILNSTNPLTNSTNQNLTAFLNIGDTNGQDVKNIFNWYVNGSSLSIFSLPFEGGSTSGNTTDNGTTRDFSSNGLNGTIVNTTFNSTSGYDNRGAYEFDGNGYISLGDQSSLDLNSDQAFSFTGWIRTNNRDEPNRPRK